MNKPLLVLMCVLLNFGKLEISKGQDFNSSKRISPTIYSDVKQNDNISSRNKFILLGGYMFTSFSTKTISADERFAHIFTNSNTFNVETSIDTKGTFMLGLLYDKKHNEYLSYLFGLMTFFGQYDVFFDYRYSWRPSDLRHRRASHYIKSFYPINPVFGFKRKLKGYSKLNFSILAGFKLITRIEDEYKLEDILENRLILDGENELSDIHPFFLMADLSHQFKSFNLGISISPAFHNFEYISESTILNEKAKVRMRMTSISLNLNF